MSAVQPAPDRHAQTPVMVIHSLVVRVTHWLNAIAIVCMIMSGWQIYNASPLFGFSFPRWATLGGWLGGAIAWHLAAMWLLAASGLVYLAYGIAGRHFMRSFFPVSPSAVWRDLKEALAFRLVHKLGVYNAIQRLFYIAVLLLAVLAVLSGLGLWKPVQFQTMVGLVGGYEVVRRIHFVAMAGIVGFLVVHLALVAIVPSTLWAMITGRARVAASPEELQP